MEPITVAGSLRLPKFLRRGSMTIITGGSSGIGKEVKEEMKKGYVLTCSRRGGEVEIPREFERTIVIPMTADLGTQDGQDFFLSEIRQRIASFQPVNLNLILNHGVLGHKDFDLGRTDEEYVIQVNQQSCIRIIDEVIALRNYYNRAAILFVSSGTKKLEELDPRINLYVKTKLGVENYLKQISFPDCVTATIFIPGVTDTRLHRRIITSSKGGSLKERHLNAKNSGSVYSPNFVARRIRKILEARLGDHIPLSEIDLEKV
jgi:short-subunit dehydrogenase